ncbi:uncharacterized protein LOC124274773 [Haliotis rubra]|uniref:uncharacterized protein LOC124274773 n=1 Tax=Haliotis rubra TaxID=36100 RepID=UPI001EE54932|nr:uncharacterized protein LOC124274773 [Haliotis rubra]
MEVPTIIFISLVLCGAKDVQADASLSELDTRVGQVERDIDAWKLTTGGNQIRMIKDFKKFELSLKEELTGTFVPTLIRRLVNRAITDILTEKYISNIISRRVLREVDSLKADFMTLNTRCVMMRNEVESCMDGLQKIQQKLPTDMQSLTSQLNQTKEDLLDTKEVISGLTEDFITLNTSCGMRKEVKPSDGNEGSSLSQVSPTTPTTTYPGTTTASTDPSQSKTVPPVTTQDSDLHGRWENSTGRKLSP